MREEIKSDDEQHDKVTFKDKNKNHQNFQK
jgi:hypothetical protein